MNIGTHKEFIQNKHRNSEEKKIFYIIKLFMFKLMIKLIAIHKILQN